MRDYFLAKSGAKPFTNATMHHSTKSFAIALAVLLGALAAPAETPTNRPAAWAQPVALEGVPNFHKVSDGLYRSAQPTAEGMTNLKKLGIKTIVNLRSFHSDKDEIGTNDFSCETITMKAWHPERKEAVRFLKIVNDPARRPALVHCLHGADRTGTMCALYRIAVQGWKTDDAIRELTDGGYNFHPVFGNLTEWLAELDMAALRKEAGLGEPLQGPVRDPLIPEP
jgi:protein tyrosine phosphatase (PTP) superfamily phosphohydrolase (DUF442 family)